MKQRSVSGRLLVLLGLLALASPRSSPAAAAALSAPPSPVPPGAAALSVARRGIPAAVPAPADEGAVVATIQAAAEAAGVTPAYLVCLALLETGFNPHARGALGERGLFQLMPGGRMEALFFARGGTDVWDAAQQSEFAAWAISAGYDAHWALAARRCGGGR